MTRRREAKGLQNALVCLLIAQLLVATALASSPQLHQLFHHDAERGDHECVVTVMISGGSDGSLTQPVFEPSTLSPVVAVVLPDSGSPDVSPLFLSAHIFEHAPPLA
jgi:hypothetical protein